jgi:putative ABC transport system substrate-binding protein
MRLIGLAVILALSLFAAPLVAAQPARQPYRIGMLMPVSGADSASNIEAFRQGLRELGYVEGQNIAIESRFADGRAEPLRGLVTELVRLKMDVIVTWGTPSAQAAKQVTQTIPIVMAAAADPVGTGLVASLSRPGGNLTGVATDSREYFGKNLELLKEIAPKVSRVAVLWDPDNPANAIVLKETHAAAKKLGVQLQALPVRDAHAFDAAFTAVIKERATALLALHNLLFFAHRSRIIDFGIKNRLPVVYNRREYVEAGGLMSYGTNFRDNFRRAATFVDKILKGARPTDLPVEEPTKYELIINMKTARALGLTIPQTLLLRADEVIQ